MKRITIDRTTIESAAKSAGMTPEKFVGTMRSISLGRRVCAHLLKVTGSSMTFVCA